MGGVEGGGHKTYTEGKKEREREEGREGEGGRRRGGGREREGGREYYRCTGKQWEGTGLKIHTPTNTYNLHVDTYTWTHTITQSKTGTRVKATV